MSCDVVYCSAKSRKSDFENYFQVSKPKVIINPQPRNTYATKVNKVNKVLFTPTYRRGEDIKSLIKNIDAFHHKISACFLQNSVELIVRPHPINVPEFIEFYKGTLDLTADLYESIKSYKCIVTDYSSIYYDCLDLDVECFFHFYDLSTYVEQVGLSQTFYQELNNRQDDLENLILFLNGKCNN